MRITKVKRKKSGGLLVEYGREAADEKVNKYTMDCQEPPAPELMAALEALVPDLRKLCELPEKESNRVIVTGVSFSYGGENQVMGAVLIGQRELKTAPTKMNLLTPHKASESYNEATQDPGATLQPETVKRLKELQNQVILYIDGKRGQTDAFDDSK